MAPTGVLARNRSMFRAGSRDARSSGLLPAGSELQVRRCGSRRQSLRLRSGSCAAILAGTMSCFSLKRMLSSAR